MASYLNGMEPQDILGVLGVWGPGQSQSGQAHLLGNFHNILQVNVLGWMHQPLLPGSKHSSCQTKFCPQAGTDSRAASSETRGGPVGVRNLLS